MRFVLLLPLAAALVACTGDARRDDASSPAALAPATAMPVVDDFGDSLAAGTPARIVSLNPTTTELLFAMGAGARLVGRTHWDHYPDSASLVADVGDGLRPNVEAVLARRPDLVVLYASADNRDAARRLRAAGVRTLALRIDTFEEFRRGARMLGLVAGEPARAAEVVDSVEATLARVRQATAALPRPTVFWHVWDAPLITIGRGSYLNELVEVAGGRNVYADLAAASPQVAAEDVLRRDPRLVLAGPEGRSAIERSATLRTLAAVRAGRIVVVDTALVGRPGARLGEAAVSLARALHPGIGL